MNLQWLLSWGRLLIIVATMVPVTFIASHLLEQGDSQRAAALVEVGALFSIWNFWFLGDALRWRFWQPGAGVSQKPTTFRAVLIILGQCIFAYLCHNLSRHFPPEGSKQWFWIPIAVMSTLLFHKGWVVVQIIPLVLMGLYEWHFHGLAVAMIWVIATFCVSGYIDLCMLAAIISVRLFCSFGNVARKLREANLQLEDQAYQNVRLAVAEERNRMAREIHDALGHSLTVINAQLEAAEALLQKSPELARQAIGKAQKTGRQGMEEIRRSINALRSGSLENQPLAEALRQLAATFEQPGLHVQFQQKGPDRPLVGPIEGALFRLCAGGTNQCGPPC